MSSQAGKNQDASLGSEQLGLGDVIVLALASSGPTQSIAVSLAAIVAAVSYAGIVPIFL